MVKDICRDKEIFAVKEKGVKVKVKLKIILLIALGLLAVPLALVAHHGAAIYDNTKRVTLEGTVTDWSWTNPHCLLEFDVKDDKGNTVHWVTETSNPTDMVKLGWTKRMFKTGDSVTVTVVPAKNGQPIGEIAQIVINGQTYKGMGPALAAPGPAGKP